MFRENKYFSFSLLLYFLALIPEENLVKTVGTRHSLVPSKVLSEGMAKKIPLLD